MTYADHTLIDWLPNHIMVLLIVIIFTVLNPLVVPFALIYFSAATGESMLLPNGTTLNGSLSGSQEPADEGIFQVV